MIEKEIKVLIQHDQETSRHSQVRHEIKTFSKFLDPIREIFFNNELNHFVMTHKVINQHKCKMKYHCHFVYNITKCGIINTRTFINIRKYKWSNKAYTIRYSNSITFC